MTAKIEIYGTSTCRKCVSVRDFLDDRKIEYTSYLIDLMPLEKSEMVQRSGRKYYPQIFINDEHIGGEKEFMMLNFEGKLDKLLGL